jgi:ABC-type branched-subunit amino acid transport system ATPase component
MSDMVPGTAPDDRPHGAGTATADGGRPAIEIEGVVKRFGGVTALNDANLTVERGLFTALIGPNGAGKSTLFNVITCHLEPDEGEVRVLGERVNGRAMWRLAQMGVARSFQTPRGFESMSVLENLLVSSQERPEGMLAAFTPRRASSRQARLRAMEVLERVGLHTLADRPYDELSAGQMHVLEIGRQLMREVSILLLDEPTAGVIPSAQERLGELLVDLTKSGITVLIVEHNLKFVFSLCSHVAVMTHGHVIRTGSPAEIQHDDAVIDAYIGRRSDPDA